MKEIFRKHLHTGIVFFGLAAALILVSAYLFNVKGDMTDFGVCYRAGGRFLNGETLYRTTDGHLQFKYSPAAAGFFAAFSLLPWEAAKIIWFIFLIVCLAAIPVVFAGMTGLGKESAWKTAGLSGLILLKYLGREFELGQVNLLILLLMILMIREWQQERNVRAGVFWGVSLLFKPYAAVFLPYFIFRKKWGTAAAGTGTFLAGLVLPSVRFGGAGNKIVLGDWILSLQASTPDLLKVGDNASLFAFLSKTLRLPSDTPTFLLGGVLVAAIVAALLWMIARVRPAASPRPELLESAVLMMLIPMLSPLGWNYNYLYGFPAVFFLVAFWGRFAAWEKAAMIADFILIGGTLREILGKALFRFYTYNALIVPCFLFLFAMLVSLRKRRAA